MVNKVSGIAAALTQPNVDTDVIMPKRFLKTITRKGLADGAFADLRFDEDGKTRPEFILNQLQWQDASILVVGNNFGCGSSREHAVWGLMQLGIKAIIGTDFGGIFYDNARKNGLVLPIVDESVRNSLFVVAAEAEKAVFEIDVEHQIIRADAQDFVFEMDPATRQALLLGQDETLDTLKLSDQIQAFEQVHHGKIKVNVNK
ncbi:3-isopropylmalate dehydratase small subunit [Kordiimonas aquimaris]|uniref:3-isopropylmalate dehydratase small subunit n=1 Tax=Kordiimonas aquimaris TaxID=707591 RepID=UPI0021D04A56|nr:3-isopropylmalate dehydratase small subunit [Kordiimonas aquimaris]